MTAQEEKQLLQDMHIVKIENHIQTAAVILFFAFGIATISDFYKKLK